MASDWSGKREKELEQVRRTKGGEKQPHHMCKRIHAHVLMINPTSFKGTVTSALSSNAGRLSFALRISTMILYVV